MEQKQEKFSTIGYIAAALGMCIGTGNVWRFPRVCAANGGGAFIIAWTIAMLVFAVPLLSTEMAFGKKTRLGCIGTFRDAGGKKYTWMGFFVAAVCFFLMSYYCVLQGYCLKYAVNSVTSAFKPNLSTETTSAMWTAFTDSQAHRRLFPALDIVPCIIIFPAMLSTFHSLLQILLQSGNALLSVLHSYCSPGSTVLFSVPSHTALLFL